MDRPISGSFDEEGRLYLTDSSGSNDKPERQLEEKPHRIVCLEDTDGDGRFDKSIVFADTMMFPEGCLWHDGSLYVSAPPSIWKLTDTNNDGIADIREEWHNGQTLTGCANDLHGPYLGPDGWIYWCKGAFREQTYDLPNGKKFQSRAAHIFRARPDHNGLEPVLTGGMDNPVGVAFTAEGERILCGTFFVTHEPGHRDGLIHAIYGGVYGKINEVTDAHKKTGDLMPIMTHMGPAAPCSVIRYESKMFGEKYQNNLFVCSFNLHKVSRHILSPDGATFKTQDTDFLTSDNPDFHPTDVIEDADGSLVVLNTGGWYKICCPTSQLSKPDVLGAVYRIRRKETGRAGADYTGQKIEDPRGFRLTWGKMSPAELVKLLGDQRPAVCKRAMCELGRAGEKAVPSLAGTLKGTGSVQIRRNAVWALTRIDGSAARDAVRSALRDQAQTVRNAALHSVSLWRDSSAIKELQQAVQEPDPQMQRIAAEALGRIGDQGSVSTLFSARRDKEDRVLEHSIIYALIEMADPGATAKGLQDKNPMVIRAALIALDQMDSGNLQAKDVTAFLGSENTSLRKTAAWVASHHPDWGDALAGFFRGRLTANGGKPVDLEDLSALLAQFGHSDAIQKLMEEILTATAASLEAKEAVLQAMASSGVKKVATGWVEAVRAALGSKEEALLRSAVATAHALSTGRTNAPNFTPDLMRIGRDPGRSADLRLEALAAIPGGLRVVEPALFDFLRFNVDSEKPVMVRSAAVTILAKAKLNQDQLASLTETVKNAGPLEMTRLLGTYEHSTNEALGLKLVAALKDAKGLSSLRTDLLKTLLTKYPQSVQQRGQELLISLNADAAKQGAHIDELLAEVKDGDIRRGQQIFNSPKAACSTCHTMGYLGGKVGPDLTTIGQVRTERDLLESIVYPSASFVRSYEPYVVSTKSDETFSGVLKKDAADEVVLATGPGAETKIARSDIADIRPGTVSVMPAGLEQQLSKQDLADLLAFLKSTKWGPDGAVRTSSAVRAASH